MNHSGHGDQPGLPAASDLPVATDGGRQRGGCAKRLIVAGIAVIGCLLLSEVTLRLFLLQDRAFRKPRSLGGADYVRESDNPVLFYEHVPGASDHKVRVRHMLSVKPDGEFNFEKVDVDVAMRINRHGFRGPDWSDVPDASTIRVAHIGDSEIFAVRLEEHETPSERLEYHLEQAFPDRKFEVLNFGVGGYNTEQQLELLRMRVLDFQPDLVVLNYLSNDPQIDVKAVLQNTSSSLLLAFLQYYIGWGGTPFDRIGPCETNAEYLSILYDSPYWTATVSLVRKMAATCRDASVGFLVVAIQPDIADIETYDARNNPYMPIYAKIENLEAPGLPVLNALPALERFNIRPVYFTVTDDDWHLGSFGVDQIAEWTAKSKEMKTVLGDLERTRK